MTENMIPREYFEKEIARAQDHINKLEEANQNMADYQTSVERIEKLRAWGLDRAISVYQTNRHLGETPSVEDVLTIAEQFCAYTYGPDYAKVEKPILPEGNA